MSEHTKGPWHVEKCSTPNCWCRMIRAEVDDVPGDPYIIISGVLREKNAYLIAAAPGMYEAIKAYLEWGPMTGSDRDLHEKAFRAAIAKAEGKAP